MFRKLRHTYEVAIVFTLILPLLNVAHVSAPVVSTSQSPIAVIEEVEAVETISQVNETKDIIEEESENTNNLVYTTTRVHLRSSNSVKSESLSILDSNTVLDAVESCEGWSLVKYNEIYGWVKSEYLREYHPESYLEIGLGYSQQDLIRDSIKEFELGVDESFIYGMIYVESRFQPTETSHAGAEGIVQVMPSTWNYLYPKLKEDFPELTKEYKLKNDSYDVNSNLLVGMYYLYHLRTNYLEGNSLEECSEEALTMYNRGPSNSDSYYKNNGTYSTKYSQDVLRAAQFIRENGYWKEGI